MTPRLRAKVFGLNATRPYKIDLEEVTLRASNDPVTRWRQNYKDDPDPSYLTHGPRTRREFLNLLKWQNGQPA
jgi:hypothetical protein